jgi:DNA-binding GntR family transcriptional regulator
MTSEDTAAESLVGELHRPLEAIVCDEIRRRIVARQLPPGSRLVESALAADLAVSRAPVREAIRRLEHEGFVTISPRRGAAVAKLSNQEVLDCYEVREALEALAHRLAARRRTPEHVERMKAALRRGDEVVEGGRWADLASANTEFHETVSSASGNGELAALLAQYSRRITWIFSISATTSGREAWAEHAAIAQSIEAGEEDLAESLIRVHLTRSRNRFIQEAGAD